MLRACVAAVGAAAVAAVAAPAHAYEFWLRAQSTGQAYRLRDYRLIGPDLILGRVRFTQALALRIWDVGDLSAARRQAHLPDRGLRISWQSYLRIDHDFGDFTSGRLTIPATVPVRRDAIDVTPELAGSVASLQLLYGHVELAGLLDDRLTVRLGRVLADDGWGTTGVDGGDARLDLPSLPVAVSASAGFRVRASSPLGLSAYELDGTSGAACQEYVEGPTPGTGAWKLIDRGRMITNHALASDFEVCPQRDVRQPTIGAAIATTRIAGFGAELGYRRTWSDTVGLIGPVDRLRYPDRGLYPDELGQAPATGVDEERLWGRVHGELRAAGLAIAPYADLRYSLLHAAIDRADAGVRLSRGDHTLEPSVEYFYPTFDGDSIFNAFSIEPTTDLRLGYQRAGGWPIRASAWLRAYHREAGEASYAGGGDAGVERGFGAWRAAASALWDDGYGGRRTGAAAEAAWRASPGLWLRGRAAVLGVARDDPGHPRYVTSSAQLASTWQLSDGVALHTVFETDRDAIHDFQVRVLGVFDLAFFPGALTMASAILRTLRARPGRLAAIAAALAVWLAAVRGAAERAPGDEWSPVVYPLQRLPIAFSHARHLGRGTPCAACHPDATTSRSAVDDLLPAEAACRACHPIDRAKPELALPGAPPVACRACHPGYAAGVVPRVYLPPPPLKFDHSAHRATPCDGCHGDLRKVDLATTQHLPTMASCLRCHTAGAEPRRCADCHLTRIGGLIETRFEHGTLVPAHDGLGDAHGPGFTDRHTQEARQTGATCTACHDPSECVACHQGVTRPMVFHPGDYIRTHAVEARRGKPDCSACHRLQSFCVGCHEREGLGTRGDTQFSATDPARAFHPAGWASAGPGPNLHARQARRSITSCASCHREDECLACHSAQPGAAHISPHPAHWRGSAQCRALDRGNRRMCLRCHVRQAEIGCDWSAR